MQNSSVEENWGDGGGYALVKVAERLVAVPRDGEQPVSMYTLIRAWVRNNPTLPLTADLPPPLQRGPTEPASGAGEGTEADGSKVKEGVPGDTEGRHQGLLSILPPQQAPTQLETDTTAPMYPLDDFDAQEPEEARRKLKDHWVAVRHYHQAIRRAKLSRHRERLQVLLGAGLLGPGFGGGSLQGGMGPTGVPQMQLGAPGQSQQGVGDPQAALAAVLALTHGTPPLDPNGGSGQTHIGSGSSMDNLGILSQQQQAGQQAQQHSQSLLGLPLVAPAANGGGNNSALPHTGSMEALLALQQQLQQLPQAPQQLPLAQQGVAGLGQGVQSMQVDGGAAGGAGSNSHVMDISSGANGS
eukprot:XP_001693083.1 predicted protein [Chlamydomonas reinhardtii]